jgi:hypothetical protein
MEKGGLRLLSNSIYNAATKSLRDKHPEFVESFTRELSESGNLSQAINIAKRIPTDVGFARWRPLLTAIFDTELAIRQIEMSLDLLKLTPSQHITISEGAWVYYHYNVCIFWIDALLDRTKKVVKQAVRALVRPNNPNWKTIESTLLASINSLSEKVGKIRDPLAHGGGAAEAPAQEKLWEGLVLLFTSAEYNKSPYDTDSLFEPMAKFHNKWYKILNDISVILLNELDTTCNNLKTQIDWPKVV